MALCKTVKSPMLMHHRYHSLDIAINMWFWFQSNTFLHAISIDNYLIFLSNIHQLKPWCVFHVLKPSCPGVIHDGWLQIFWGPSQYKDHLFKGKNSHCKGSMVLIPFRWVTTLRPSQNGRHFPDDMFIFIFLNENVWILVKISLKFVPKGPINNIPALIQMMAWRRPGDKPLSEPLLVNLLTHICVTRPQLVNARKT